MSDKKRELKREYKQQHRPMGIFQVRNLANDMVLIGASLDLPGIINRYQFQLSMGNHPNRALQADWHRLGSESFVFEILDELTPGADATRDYREDLAFLEQLWLEKLEPYEERGYNEKKKGKEEKLRLIAQKRAERE